MLALDNDGDLDLNCVLFREPSLGGRVGVSSPTTCNLSLEVLKLVEDFGGRNGG